jgi:chemotaxis protein MotB
MPDNNAAPIIVIKKKVAGHGHHGGAWKVAYADFVTAMMALFIVLWLLSSDEKVKKAVGGYFQDPTGAGREMGTGLAGVDESLTVSQTDMTKLKEKIEQAIRSMPQMQKIAQQLKMTITGEGLRIEMLETDKGVFFASGSANPSETCVAFLTTLAQELGKLPNLLVIEGHTDSKPFGTNASYTNWELSSDRANSARRVMQNKGIRVEQVSQVRGFADMQPFKKDDPAHDSNRRITVIVKYNDPPPGAEEAAEGGAKGDGHAETGGHGKPGADHGSSSTEHGAKPEAGHGGGHGGDHGQKPAGSPAPTPPSHGAAGGSHAQGSKEHASAGHGPSSPASGNQASGHHAPGKPASGGSAPAAPTKAQQGTTAGAQGHSSPPKAAKH